MSVLSWIRLSVCLWLLRKAAKLTGWLLLAAAAVWLFAAALRGSGWRAVALAPVRDWEHGWA